LPTFVLFFNCPQAISRERVLNRKVEGRNDTEQMFEKRYAEFAVENPAIVAYYRGKGQLIEVCYPTLFDIFDR
jgi:adenylate kinase family enzyme